jgi:putative hydrolase of the HAD superfamily
MCLGRSANTSRSIGTSSRAKTLRDDQRADRIGRRDRTSSVTELPVLRAVTLDYWDTLYDGSPAPRRKDLRRVALLHMLERIGARTPPETLDRLYVAAAAEAHRWWRDEHRGYTTADRIRWILAQLAIERPTECEHVAAAVAAVDDTLLSVRPALLPGAAEAVRALAPRYRLAIVSDTGFVSGAAQDRLLALDGLREHFDVTVYSMDVGHAKPRPEPFHAALAALGVEPSQALHVGDNERTDVGGALAVGMRAVRLDVLRVGDASRAEHVAKSLGALVDYLLAQRR